MGMTYRQRDKTTVGFLFISPLLPLSDICLTMDAAEKRPPEKHYAQCERCGHTVERRRLKRHHKSAKCVRAVEKLALESGRTVQEVVAAAGPPPPRANYNHDERHVECPRCGEPDIAESSLSVHYKSRRCRERSDYDEEAENKSANELEGVIEPVSRFLTEKSGLASDTKSAVLAHIRRFVKVSGKPAPEADLVELACDQDLVDRFVRHMRDDRRLTVGTMLRGIDALRWLLDYVVVVRPPGSDQHERGIAAQRKNLQLIKRRIRSDPVANENGGAGGKTREQLEELGEWTTVEKLTECLKKGRKEFTRDTQHLLDHQEIPTPVEARRAAAFMFLAIVVGGSPVRTGTLEGLTPNEVRELVREGSVTTSRFKTARTYGAVAIDAPDWLRGMLIRYYKAVHLPVSRGRPQKYFFIVDDGVPVSKSGREVAKLTRDFIGVSIHITRIRQILETYSKERLSKEDQEAVSGAMAHSSRVARTNYQKEAARDKARRARLALASGMDLDEEEGEED